MLPLRVAVLCEIRDDSFDHRFKLFVETKLFQVDLVVQLNDPFHIAGLVGPKNVRNTVWHDPVSLGELCFGFDFSTVDLVTARAQEDVQPIWYRIASVGAHMHEHSFAVIDRTLCFDEILRFGSGALPGKRIQSRGQFLDLEPQEAGVDPANAEDSTSR
jgi:hypothetical protein